MRFCRVFSVLLLITLCITWGGQAEYKYKLDLEAPFAISEDLLVEKVEEGIVKAVHTFPWGANSLVIEMRNSDVVLIDTPYTYEATKELVEWIRGHTGAKTNFIAINTTHSPDNITVYYPEKKILFGGCMIKELSAANLGNTDDANLELWPVSVERLKAKYNETNVKIIIPGHGKAGDIRLLDKTLELTKK